MNDAGIVFGLFMIVIWGAIALNDIKEVIWPG